MADSVYKLPAILEPWRQYIVVEDNKSIEELLNTPVIETFLKDPAMAMRIMTEVMKVRSEIDLLLRLHKAKEIK